MCCPLNVRYSGKWRANGCYIPAFPMVIAPAGEGNRVLLMRGLAPDSTHEEIRDRIGAEIVRLAAAAASADTDSVAAGPARPITDGRPAISKVILIRNKH